MKIAAREQTTEKARNFKAILTKIKRFQPDVVMYGSMEVTCGPFAKGAATLGVKSKILAGDGVRTNQLARWRAEHRVLGSGRGAWPNG